MDLNDYIFGDIRSNTYKKAALYSNYEEEKFRTITRKTLYPDWTVFKTKTKKWITREGILDINITTYQKWDKEEKRNVRFMYLHNDIAKELKYTKYEISIFREAIIDYLEGRTIHNKPNWPSVQLVRYWIKKFKIEERIKEKNEELLEEVYTKIEDEKEAELDIQIDDLFIKSHSENKVKKCRYRLNVLSFKKSIVAGGIAYFDEHLVGVKQEENKTFDSYVNKIDKLLSSLKIDRKKLTINGDGATWMKTLSHKLNVEYVLDFFHLKKIVNATFGFNKFTTKDSKMFFKKWTSNVFGDYWINLFNAVFDSGNIEQYLLLKDTFLEEIKTKNVPESVNKNIKIFIKFINKTKILFEIKVVIC